MKLQFVGLLVAGVMFAAGCAKRSAPSAEMMMTLPAAPPPAASGDSEKSQRYIAEHHKLEVIATEAELQKSWESLVAFCGTIRCEVLSSSVTTKSEGVEPSGEASLRVAPEDLPKLLGQVEKSGKVARHTTEREDKTTAVVDSEARIKNLTAFRDNLRAMLGKPSATVQNLIEIQKQLSETQTQLDSEATNRKILANETEKVAVEVSFNVEGEGSGGSAWHKIRDALRESGSNLAESTAALITVIVALIPWLVVIVPGIWLLVRVGKRWKRKRAAGGAAPAA